MSASRDVGLANCLPRGAQRQYLALELDHPPDRGNEAALKSRAGCGAPRSASAAEQLRDTT